MKIEEEIKKTFGNKLRVRVCGILQRQNSLLLVKHKNLGKKGVLWAPPGGGVNFSESCKEALIREFKEETGIEVRVKKFLFINEYLDPPLHAIELFFHVEKVSGKLSKGNDPELKKNQIIKDVHFIEYPKLKEMDPDIVHSIFKRAAKQENLLSLSGYYKNP